jgi:uridine kinase
VPAPIIVGICGGTGSGKTTFCNKIAEKIGPQSTTISQDMYYKDLSHIPPEQRDRKNFDHPDAFDNDLFCGHLSALKQGKPVEVPEYDFVSHTRTGKHVLMNPTDIVLVDGIMLFTEPEIRDLFDYKIFIDVDSDVRFIRRLKRDIEERGRSVHSVIDQYLNSVKPMHDEYVEPNKRYADLVVFGEDIDRAVARIRALPKRD